MDSKSSSILTSYQSKLSDSKASSNSFSNNHDHSDTSDNDSDLDSLLELLDEDADSTFAESAYREQRMQQLSKEIKESKVRHSDASTVETLKNEAKLFTLMEKMDTTDLNEQDLANLNLGTPIPIEQASLSTNSNSDRKRADTQYRSLVVHFFHPDFKSCKLLDAALAELSSKHFNTTKFVRINAVSDCPFLVVKFGLRVLPAVLAFKDGKLIARFNGLDSLVEPTTLARLVKMKQEADKNKGSVNGGLASSNPMDTLQRLDSQWIEKVFVERGILFRNTLSGAVKNSNWNDESESEEEDADRKKRLGYSSIRTGKASSWKSTKKYGDNESDDDDALDI